MLTLAAAFFLSLGLSLLFVPLCRRVAFKVGTVARPREDRWHRKPTALFGGVAIGLSLFIVVSGFGRADDVPVLLACAVLMFVGGLVDDLKNLKPSTKLVLEIVLASVLLFFGFRLNWLSSITGDAMLTLVWIVGVTNAFNLLDNMDGLCAGIALIVGTTLLIEMLPNIASGPPTGEMVYLVALLGATAGFLVYNVWPASIFMGDSGSLMLGFSLAALTLGTTHDVTGQSNVLTAVAAPVFVLLIPIFDTTLVTVMRKLAGRPASQGGRDHSSHRLVAIGLSERAAVAVLWLLAAIGGSIAVVMKYVHQSWSVPAGALFLIGMSLFAVYLARIRVYEQGQTAPHERGFTPLVFEFMYKRRVAEVLLDFCLIAFSYYLAYRLRFEGEDFLAEFKNFVTSLPVVLASQLVAFFLVGVYRGVWRYFGIMDAVTVFKGVVLGTVIAQLVILYLYHFFSYSRTVFVIDAMLLVGLVTLSRASFRLVGEFVLRQRSAGRRAVIVGAGDAASVAVNQLRDQQESIKILGFVDDDPKNLRMRVAGYQVLGDYRALEVLVSTASVDLVVVSSRLVDAGRLAELEALCSEHGVALARLHVGLEELVPTRRTPPAVSDEAPLRKVRP